MVQWAMGWFRDDVMFGWAEFQSWLKIAETLSLPNKGKKWEKQRGSRIALPLETILSESMWFKISWTWRGWKKPFPKRKHTCHKTKSTRPLVAKHCCTKQPPNLHPPPMSAKEWAALNHWLFRSRHYTGTTSSQYSCWDPFILDCRSTNRMTKDLTSSP